MAVPSGTSGSTSPSSLRRGRTARALGAATLTAFVAVGTALTGCSDSSTENKAASDQSAASSYTVPAAATTEYPLTVKNCGRDVTFQKAPSRVVILSGASVGEVESLLVLDQQDKIVGNMQNYGVSDEPGMVQRINALPTVPGATPAEQILATKPDLVISTWAGGFDPAAGAPTRDQLAEKGIASYVNPAQCGTPEDAQKKPGIKDSFEMLMDFGRIFNAQNKAVDYITAKQKAIEDAVKATSKGNSKDEDVHALIAFPGMAAMNANGLPAIMTGGIYDDILAKVGAKNSIEGDAETTKTLTSEKLASAKVDVLVVGRYLPTEDPEKEANKLFAKYPQWEASKNKRWVSVSDSIYYGPLNDIAVTKISEAAKK